MVDIRINPETVNREDAIHVSYLEKEVNLKRAFIVFISIVILFLFWSIPISLTQDRDAKNRRIDLKQGKFVKIRSISEIVWKDASIEITQGEEPNILEVKLLGKINSIDGRLCFGCVKNIKIGPNITAPIDPIFVNHELNKGSDLKVERVFTPRGELYDVFLIPVREDFGKGPYLISGPDGATLEKKLDGFILLSGHAGVFEEVDEESSFFYKFSETDLIYAVMGGDIEKVKKIVASGVDINCKDTSGNTPLILASSYSSFGHNKIVELLISRGADLYMRNDNSTNALGLATYKGNTDIVETLLASGVSPDIKINDQGATALMVAAVHGHENIASLLLEKGAKVSAQSQDGTTPLMYAVLNRHHEVVKVLLENGADINLRNKKGQCALDLAEKKGHLRIIELLQQK